LPGVEPELLGLEPSVLPLKHYNPACAGVGGGIGP